MESTRNSSSCVILDNLDNLYTKWVYPTGEDRRVIIPKSDWVFAICRLRDISSTYYWSSHIMVNTRENHYIRATGNGDINYGQIRDMSMYGENYIFITASSYTDITPNTEIELIIFYYFD